MTTVSGLDAAQSGNAQKTTAQSQNVMGKDHFLKLLVAQIQNQDPLNPMDSTGFTAQLAQFSSLEQLQNVNTNLSNLSAAQASLSNAQAVSFIGKTVTAKGSHLEVRDGNADPIQFSLNADAEAVQIGVYDAAGNFIRSLQGGKMSEGRHSINWDGLNQEGNRIAEGKYDFKVLAVDAKNNAVNVTTYTNGKVTGVNYKNGTPYLLANQIEIPLSSVISVAEPVEAEN